MDPTTYGPLIRDTDYRSPTYGQMIADPAYRGNPVTTADGKTIYAGGGSSSPSTGPSRDVYLKNFSIWAANNPGATQEQGQQAMDYFYRQAGGVPSSGGGYVPPVNLSSSSPSGSFGLQNATSAGSSAGGGYFSRYGNNDFTSEAEKYLSTFRPPKTEEEIYQEQTQRAQSRIDALNKYYDSLLLEQSRENEKRSAEQNALSVISGLAGSSEASAARMRTESINNQLIAKIQAQRNLELQNIYKEIQSDAYNRFMDELSSARQSANDAMKMQAAREEKASRYVQILASSGFDLDKIRTLDPRTYRGLSEAVGGEQMLRALYALNIPREKIRETKIVNGMQIITYDTPSGGVRTEVIDLGLPKGTVLVGDTGGYLLYGKADASGEWDGDLSTTIKIGKTLSAKDQQALNIDWYNAQTARMRAESELEDGGATGGATGIVERDAQAIMQGTMNLQDVSTKNNYRAKVGAELARLQQEALAKNDLVGVMKASAAYDKEPSDTFLTSMEKTQTTLSQIGTLAENIKNMKTGPIVGAFRSKNPWDTKAQVIKAELNSIVPNLARGVYGEVGVLTDNDIKVYSQTLPNLTSTEDIRNAILYITVDQIKKNVEIKIRNQAAGQRDMSGYAGLYSELKKTADGILSQIGGGETSLIQRLSPEQKAQLQAEGLL